MDEENHEQESTPSTGTTHIGIDLGTSHCTAAVWDSTRGHPKWMRLSVAVRQDNGKEGRLVPSAVLFLTRTAAEHYHLPTLEVDSILSQDDAYSTPIVACVGAPALQALETAAEHDASDPSYADVSAALVTSSKRFLGLLSSDHDVPVGSSLPLFASDNQPESEQEIAFVVRPLGKDADDTSSTILVTPSQATSILLLALRQACEAYLRANVHKKQLRIPGHPATACRNAVIGVPAHYTQRQRQLVTRAARRAGFASSTAVTESTAAAMAYGIFVRRPATDQTLLVLDSGGGTTDVTIAVMTGESDKNTPIDNDERQRFHVVVTEGDGRLGGDDMDAALLEVVLQKAGHETTSVNKNAHNNNNNNNHRRKWLHECRRAKERLCGDVDHGYQKPEESVTVSLLNKKYAITQDDLEQALQPWLERATRLVHRALERYAKEKTLSVSDVCMHEVILVGGATRVPAVRRMLRDLFPPPPMGPADLCLSVNAMSAVAQGAAIQAAIQSGKVPRHEVRSAMMLDTVPHAIGVLMSADDSSGEATFVEIIPRDAPLPASGAAMFQLAHVKQPGVSLTAVEEVEEGQLYPKLGDFTFLLARLSDAKLAALGGTRSIEIRMSLLESGEFRVSYKDENDPEHAGLKSSRRSKRDSTNNPVLSFERDGEALPFQQVMLLVSCVVLLLAYVAARIYFQDELSIKSE